MLYEQRIYHAMPGRMPDLLKRFESITLGFFERYGIRQAGFWTIAVGGSTSELIYLLQWESMAEREQKWNAFASDPDWVRQKKPRPKPKARWWTTLPTSFCSRRRFRRCVNQALSRAITRHCSSFTRTQSPGISPSCCRIRSAASTPISWAGGRMVLRLGSSLSENV